MTHAVSGGPARGLRRRLYRGGRAGAIARWLNAGQARLAARGIGPRWLVTVEVPGRRTGRTIAFPAVVADYDAGKYLVSMLGEHANWVQNVRAAHGRAVLVHGRRTPVSLEEVPVDRRAPIIRSYLARARGARPHIPVSAGAPLEAFATIAGDYPVFRIATRTQ